VILSKKETNVLCDFYIMFVISIQNRACLMFSQCIKFNRHFNLSLFYLVSFVLLHRARKRSVHACVRLDDNFTRRVVKKTFEKNRNIRRIKI